MPDELPIRVVVEIATPETVKRLEDENAKLRKELGAQKDRIEVLHRTIYELMGVVSELKRKLDR